MYTLLSRAGHVLQRMLGLMTESFGNRLPAIKSLVHQNSTTYILVLQSLELLASSRLFSNSSRVELPRSLDSRREEYDRHNEKRRARYAEDATFRKEEFAREHNRTNNFDYRRSQAFKSWVIRQLKKGQSASSIIWDTHVPLLRQDTPGRLFCTGCGKHHAPNYHVFWERKDQPGIFGCHAYYTRSWSRVLPLNAEELGFGTEIMKNYYQPGQDGALSKHSTIVDEAEENATVTDIKPASKT